MFHASRALSAANAAQYYETEFRRGDYYTRGGDAAVAPGQWIGHGGAELNLRGDVQPADFAALLDGRAPGGERLVQAQQATGKRRAGWDFTCSADKSVSIAALVYDDARLIAAHDAAVNRALTELERFVQTRAHGGTEIQTTGRMVAATFRHESSRALDPQLHTHVVVLNLTRRDDGEWRALDPRSLFQAQKYATAIYRAEMARDIERLGYRLDVRKDGAVGIGGFTRDQLDAFSQRRAQVIERARELGKTTAEVGQEAAFDSRADKRRDVDPQTLQRQWRETARKVGLDRQSWYRDDRTQAPLLRRLFGRRAKPERVQATPDFAAKVAVEMALEHLTERRATFRVEELERMALERGVGWVRLDDVRGAIAARPDLVRAGGVITTQAAIDRERNILELWRAGRGRGHTVSLDHLRPGLAGEQLAAARHILNSRDRVIGVEGKAGAGKSHLLAPVVEAFRADGWHVRGLAPTTSAAAVLGEHHIAAVTVARFLRQPEHEDRAWREMPVSRVQVPVRQVWLVDEAGLLSSAQMEPLLRRAAAVDAKVVLVGDRMQHKAIEAGRPFEQLVDAGLKTARLDRIQRQRDPELRAAVQEAARGNAARALLELDKQRHVIERADRGERLSFVAEYYMRLNGSRLVTTATNADRRDVNALIRQARIAAGQVEARGVRAEILVAKDLTTAQRKDARSYDVGDLVTYSRGSRGYGVEPGARGRVIETDVERSRISVQFDGGSVLTYEPRRLSGVDVARVEERELSKGDRIEFRQPDKTVGVVNGQLGQIIALDQQRRQARVRLDGSKRVVTVDLSRAQALDLGYASTSYRSQGRTVDHVIDVQDSRIASREGFYVGTSRGSASIMVVTDDRDALVRRLERAITREPSALDVERALSRERTAREAPERRPPTPPARLRIADLPVPAPLRDFMRDLDR